MTFIHAPLPDDPEEKEREISDDALAELNDDLDDDEDDDLEDEEDDEDMDLDEPYDDIDLL